MDHVEEEEKLLLDKIERIVKLTQCVKKDVQLFEEMGKNVEKVKGVIGAQERGYGYEEESATGV